MKDSLIKPTFRPLTSKKPEWNDDVKRVEFFDPEISKKSQIRSKRDPSKSKLTQDEKEIYEPMQRQNLTGAQDNNTRLQQRAKDAMADNSKKVFESYHTLKQVQTIIDIGNTNQSRKLAEKYIN